MVVVADSVCRVSTRRVERQANRTADEANEICESGQAWEQKGTPPARQLGAEIELSTATNRSCVRLEQRLVIWLLFP